MSAARDRRIADEHLASLAPCNRCALPSPREDLATFGAMCQPCYADYLAERNPRWWPNRALAPHELAAVIRRAKERLARMGDRPDPKAWARRLQAREEAGQPVTALQRRMWREALHLPAAAPVIEPEEVA